MARCACGHRQGEHHNSRAVCRQLSCSCGRYELPLQPAEPPVVVDLAAVLEAAAGGRRS
jgi:hypothetical protein